MGSESGQWGLGQRGQTPERLRMAGGIDKEVLFGSGN